MVPAAIGVGDTVAIGDGRVYKPGRVVIDVIVEGRVTKRIGFAQRGDVFTELPLPWPGVQKYREIFFSSASRPGHVSLMHGSMWKHGIRDILEVKVSGQ